MSDEVRDELRASDLPLTLYLNQRVTFDLLATLQDGFAQLTTLQESSSDAKSSEFQGEGGLGISNVFALLGVKLGAKASRGTTTSSSGTTTQEMIHTPTSLFASLRQELRSRGLIREIGIDGGGFDMIEPGDFIEFQAVLRRSPLIDILTTFRDLTQMLDGISPAPPPISGSGAGKGPRRGAPQRNDHKLMLGQIETLMQAITSKGSQDLVADCGLLRFVLPSEEAYFVDSTMNDVIDGTFRVFGKVTSVIVRDGTQDGISLLRKSALGNFRGVIEQLGTALESLPDSGFSGPKVETVIPAPTLLVIPVGIFT